VVGSAISTEACVDVFDFFFFFFLGFGLASGVEGSSCDVSEASNDCSREPDSTRGSSGAGDDSGATANGSASTCGSTVSFTSSVVGSAISTEACVDVFDFFFFFFLGFGLASGVEGSGLEDSEISKDASRETASGSSTWGNASDTKSALIWAKLSVSVIWSTTILVSSETGSEISIEVCGVVFDFFFFFFLGF